MSHDNSPMALLDASAMSAQPGSAASRRPRPSPRQVEAWLYGPVERLVKRLREECARLEQDKAPSWNHERKQCDAVCPISESVAPDMVPILAQLLRFNDDLTELGVAHDAAIPALERAALAFEEKMLALPEISVIFKRVRSHGYRHSADDPGFLVQDLINGSFRFARDYGASSATSKKAIAELQELRKHATVQEASAALEAAVAHAGRCSRELLVGLTVRRDQLADDYGLPPTTAATPPVEPADPRFDREPPPLPPAF